jgi:hypothetical protein
LNKTLQIKGSGSTFIEVVDGPITIEGSHNINGRVIICECTITYETKKMVKG